MVINVMISEEVYTYFAPYDLSKITDLLIDMYEIETLPQIATPTTKQVRLDITNPLYILLYNTFGPRSKKVSIGRLLDFAYNLDILSLKPELATFTREYSEPTPITADTHIAKAIEHLVKAMRIEPREIIKIVLEALNETHID